MLQHLKLFQAHVLEFIQENVALASIHDVSNVRVLFQHPGCQSQHVMEVYQALLLQLRTVKVRDEII